MDHEAPHKRILPDTAEFDDAKLDSKRRRLLFKSSVSSSSVDVDDNRNGLPKHPYTDVGVSHVDSMCIDVIAPSPNDEIVCYGALCDARVRLNVSFISNLLTTIMWDPFCELEAFMRGSSYYLRRTSDSDDVGVLDLVSTNTLKLLHRLPGITQTVVLALDKLRKAAEHKTQKPPILDASINILGPRSLLENVGDAIANGNSHLQHPYYLATDIDYINPHYFYPHNIRTNLRHLIGPVTGDSEHMRLAHGLREIFDDLTPSPNSDFSCTDMIGAAHATGLIATPLKQHQKEGVKYILIREDYGHAASASKLLEDAIAIRASKKSPSPMLGGINADVMGLGKTFTMLVAIVCSMEAAMESLRSYDEVTASLKATRATLVVAPSPQVMEVWRSEIDKHLKPGILHVCAFHGSSRAKNVRDITDHDIVLTTYNTLVSDQKSRKLLQQIAWFRVVLDEAHIIRNSTSRQFKAAYNIKASRRWCLTGTPIHNSLDDLRSLLAFLHFNPFSETGFFRKHIVEPLNKESPDQFKNLKLLLHVTCFRRTVELLSLPSHTVEEVTIISTDPEGQLYEDVLTMCKKEFNEIANMRSSKKRYSVLFATIMKLRRLCNHGTFQQESPITEIRRDNNRTKGSNAIERNSLEEISCAYCHEDNADIGFASDTLEVCPGCSRVLDCEVKTASGSVSPMPYDNSAKGVVSPGQLLAEPPFSASRRDLPSKEYTGFSSKLNAVVGNIQRSPTTSKHIVFTSWRLTLDILQHLLCQQGIPCLRIDGQTTFPDRQSILTLFREDPTQNVLLLSIVTGAVGLTLTVADRVHVVEPQWNPMVEEQAIGRALRIGQNRCVKIFKYITKSTVEQNIVSRQKRKNHLASISLDSHSDHADERLEDLMFILQRGAS
ncbi:SNF2 family N-terminal domain-containing protein [Xylaria cubensis]|nr:SNF2 family N-terminal domain-containing protein [Xylaria cubensis]